MFKKYIVYPDFVRSKNDGDIHFIDFATLCRLYRVNPEHCINASIPGALIGIDTKMYIHLEPRFDGRYEIQ